MGDFNSQRNYIINLKDERETVSSVFEVKDTEESHEHNNERRGNETSRMWNLFKETKERIHRRR